MTETQAPAHPAVPHARIGLLAIFGSTLFQLSGIFMLSPLLLLLLKKADVSTTIAGLFAATSWLGVFLITPFAAQLTRRLGRRNALWLASGLPLVTAVGFLLTDNLVAWFALELLASVAGGLRWVLAETFIAEFAPRQHMGRYIGMYATMIGLTFVIGPGALAWLGADSPWALWIVIALLAIGLAWTALIPRTPPDADTHTAAVGWAGLWRAFVLHPVIMLAGFVGGFFELGLASILPLVGLHLNLGDSAAALLVAVSGAGGTMLAMPSGMLADQFKSPANGRRTLMAVLAACLCLSAGMTLFLELHAVLVWPIAFIWGAAGGTLYTLTMTDIAAREQGITLVNSTAVLVLSYTLGALMASSTAGALLDWSPAVGFPVALIAVAFVGLLAIVWARRSQRGQP